MTFRRIPPVLVAAGLGAVSLAMILGALGFEYLGGYRPCELCMWQRFPHYAAIIVGLGGAGAAWAWGFGPGVKRLIAETAMVLIAVSGVIAVYHAGVEWHFWAGPMACTGNAFKVTGPLNLNGPVVMCDVASWRLFGISLAGYNALISLGAAGLAAILLMLSRNKPVRPS